MSKFDFHKAAKRFIMGESRKKEPSMNGYLYSLEEILSSMSPRNKSDAGKMEMAVESIRGIKRHYRRISERLNMLEEENKNLLERLTVLEENKD